MRKVTKECLTFLYNFITELVFKRGIKLHAPTLIIENTCKKAPQLLTLQIKTTQELQTHLNPRK